MAQYQMFRQQVESALVSLANCDPLSAEKTHHLLNGAASDALTGSFTRSERTNDGIFFSGRLLSQKVAACIETKIRAGATIADPTCGAGDLLLGCMALAERGAELSSTLKQWSERVTGLDIHAEFAETTKVRLALLAAEMHREGVLAPAKTAYPQNVFDKIQKVDFFEAAERVSDADCVVMNPPFYDTVAPKDCSWGSGNTQIAARFVEKVVMQAKESQEIVAVLPDVLRSGTRYARWRSQIEQRCEILSLHVYGRFDKKTDVDVFVVHLRKSAPVMRLDSRSGVEWNLEKTADAVNNQTPALQDLFDVSVGAVVPHRHKALGPWFHYLEVSNAPSNKETMVTGKKRTLGTVHQAPFVAIRRTSSPSDPKRIVATLVLGKNKIAVENHLIVVKPKDQTLATCRLLMKALKKDYVEEWINQAIRCRHLTTSAIKRLPLIGWPK